MQQVVDLQSDASFKGLGIQLLSISPDPPEAWKSEGVPLGITTPMLSDPGANVASEYGVMQWAMGTEPGHTFVLVDTKGRVAWVRDYGGPEHGGLMYVSPNDLLPLLEEHL
jgi:peroxiredoxin